MFDDKKRATFYGRPHQSQFKQHSKELSMTLIKIIKSIDVVLKRHAFKAQNYDNLALINWVDFADVREHFSYLSNLILQAVLTQPAKDSPSFLACSSIFSSKSSSKRIPFFELPERSYLFFSVFTCIGVPHGAILIISGDPHYIGVNYKKQCPKVLEALLGHITQPLKRLMIMANRYDNAHLCARQSKVFKFYNTLTAQVVQIIAINDAQARVKLHSNNLAFISRKPLTTGVYHA